MSVVACEQEPPTIGFLPAIEVNRNPHTSTATASGPPVGADMGLIPLAMVLEIER